MASDNAEIVKHGYDAWNRGDMATVLELVDPHFEWREASEVPGGGEVYTREQFEAYLRSLERHWEDFRLEPQELRQTGDHVLVEVPGLGRGRTSGAQVAQRFVHVWTLHDRRACRMRAYLEKGEAMEALGLLM